MKASVPKGQRFSHVYLERGEPMSDSVRMRHRLASLFYATYGMDGLRGYATRELGVSIPYASSSPDWGRFFEKSALRDVLDIVTLAFRHLKGEGIGANALVTWTESVGRIFSEENVRYRVDEVGGVHFAIDGEFEHNRTATISALSSSRFANVLSEFLGAFLQLDAIPPNGKGAIRATFTAAEGLFRLMYPSAPRLTSSEIKKHLTPTLQRLHKGDAATLGASAKLLSSFQEWVEAAHFYRHEPGKEEIAQPPLTLAINMVSLGASYIRWLAEIDAAQLAGKN